MKRQWLALGAIPLLVAIALPLRVSAQSALTTAKLERSKDIDASSAADRLMQQGNQAYQVGQLEAAVKFWQQARKAYQPLQNRAGEAIALANLGAVYVALERYRDAIAALEAFLPLAHSWATVKVKLGRLATWALPTKNSATMTRHYDRTDKLAS
jgi:tetratricopeptide (TPR) repeat protein